MDHSTFTPTHEWQDVPPDVVLPEGCQVRLNTRTGNQQARWAESNGHAAPESDLESELDQAYRQQQEGGEPEALPEGDALFDLSHDGLALDMGRQWQPIARHVALWGKWLFWNGARWEPADRLEHMTRCRDYLRRRADNLVRDTRAGKLKWGKKDPEKALEAAEALAKQLRSEPMRANVCSMARSNAELVGSVGQWDRDPAMLCTPVGTVSLRTGDVRPSEPGHYMTKITAVAPAPAGTPAPIWQAFLERIFKHDHELVPFVQRALGYSLLGEIRDHVLLFCWGQGGNGKSVLLNTVSRILGDYSEVAPSDLLLVAQSDRHPCDMAMLRGARLVTAQELAPGRAWDEPKLKSLTGGDQITARFMRQDFFTYEPQFTLWVAGNHKPSLRSVDEAIRRRILLVPFTQVIPDDERDHELPKKLRAEWPAILRWTIDGCLAYQSEGLNPPQSARDATRAYLEAEDTLGQWLSERCVVHHRIEWTPLKALYADWAAWCDERRQRPGTARSFGKLLDERGFVRGERNVGQGFCGLGPSSGGSGGFTPNTRMGASAAQASNVGQTTTSTTDAPNGSPGLERIGTCAYCRDAAYDDDAEATDDGLVLHNRCVSPWHASRRPAH